MKYLHIKNISSEDEMIIFGNLVGRILLDCRPEKAKKATLLFFEGDLGVGKTTICKGILNSSGYDGIVKSPTYNLVETYELASSRYHHFDFYRLGSPEELDYIGIRDYFQSGDICLVEWPDRGKGFLPAPDLCLKISAKRNGRELNIESKTQLGELCLNHLSIAKENQLGL
ncbi:tRNA (adenosine(37)-N6)-threonylcarbamoyltransferase complex ATPase subunit type 1 TsaE [Porticoccus sp.]|jgi:tRNA threonylcarbamoyladenosine biosynthesis protein TsaE|nr:tRNA (adenosine(37)-N6)-threonylcarbamoyltransferase complex ATPase subunit type 1 TsaE [Porticoccus sp.]